jgi:predicted dienelactone hydrolase
MRMIAATLVIVSMIAAGVFLWGQAQGADLPANTEAATLIKPGPNPVRLWGTKIEDKNRSTPHHGAFAGTNSRKMQVSVWYPGGPAASGPLIIYSHGFSGGNKECKYLMQHLASLGYVAAAPNFPSTNGGASGGAYLQDVVNQPADQHFLINQLLLWNQTPGNPLAGRIDSTRIGAMGTSLGGLTTTLLAFDRNRMDSRIKAAVSIAGLHVMFNSAFYAHRDLPYMVVAGTSDLLVPYASNAAPIVADIPGAILVSIKRGSHLGFIGLSRYLRFLKTPDTVGCFAVRLALKRNPLTSGFEIIGGAEDGVRAGTAPEFCGMNPPTPAMDPRQQQRMTTVAVTAFFQSQFSATEAERVAMHRYLIEGLPKELQDVSVSVGAAPGDDLRAPLKQF